MSCPRWGCRGQQTCFLEPICTTPRSCGRVPISYLPFITWKQFAHFDSRNEYMPLFLEISSLPTPVLPCLQSPCRPLPSPPSLPSCPLPLSCCSSPLFLFQFFLVEFLSFKVFLLPPHAPPNDGNLPEGRLCVLTSPRTLHGRHQWKPAEIMLGKD